MFATFPVKWANSLRQISRIKSGAEMFQVSQIIEFLKSQSAWYRPGGSTGCSRRHLKTVRLIYKMGTRWGYLR